MYVCVKDISAVCSSLLYRAVIILICRECYQLLLMIENWRHYLTRYTETIYALLNWTERYLQLWLLLGSHFGLFASFCSGATAEREELMELSNVLMSPLNVSVFDGLPPNYTVKKGQFKQNVTSKFCRIQLILIVKLFLNLSYFTRWTFTFSTSDTLTPQGIFSLLA